MPCRCAFAGTGYGAHDRHAALPSLALPLRGNRIPTLGPKRFHQGNHGYDVRVGAAGNEVGAAGDSVDRLLRDWDRERRGLGFSPAGIVTLRRAGAPYRLPQTQLIAQLGLTSGTVSVRVDRLVSRSVVGREDAPDDRRGQLVRLTG